MRKPLLCGTTNSIGISSTGTDTGNTSNSSNSSGSSTSYGSAAFIKVEDMSRSGSVPNFVDVVVGDRTRVDRVRKIFSSPLLQKPSAIIAERAFGVSLEDQPSSTEGGTNDRTGSVPFVVHRICDYIECSGFHHEGLFRVSGSLRTMEKLRTSFDRTGDADLEETADVMAAAGLLKQYLRALPEPVIPTGLHEHFLKVQQENCQSSSIEECIRQLKRLVEQLPEPNFNLLKYLMGFLVKVAAAEQYNRMNANSLGIVFGPSLFRVASVDGVDGLREQSIANQLVSRFVHDYWAIFEADTSESIPSSSSTVTSSTSTVAVGRTTNVISPLSSASSTASQNAVTTLVIKPTNSAVPKLDVTKTAVPSTEIPVSFASILDSPKDGSTEDNRSKVIEMTISNAVCRNLYGENSGQDKLRPPLRLKHKKLELSPDGAANNKLARSNSEERSTSDKQRQHHHQHHQIDGTIVTHGFEVGLAVRKCNSHEDVHDDERQTATTKGSSNVVGDNKCRQQHEEKVPADSTSLKKFASSHAGNQSQAMTPLNIDTSTQAIPDLRKRDWGRHHDGENDCSEARRSMERLQNFSQFQRSSVTSKGRRPATLKGSRRCVSMDVVRNDEVDEDSLKENFGCRSPCGDCSRVTKHFQKRSSSLTLVESPTLAGIDDNPMPDDLELEKAEVAEDAMQTKRKDDTAGDNGDSRKPRLWLLDLHDATPVSHPDDQRTSPNASTQKPYVPPLDLTTLHEHGDGSDPIPTNHLRASWPFIHNHQNMYDEVMLSPRTNSLEKMSNAFVDSSIPPSPPSVLDISRKSASFKDEEEREASFRSLNKKVASLKRKIKQYEDGFEDEYGYRPSHAEKTSQVDVKKYMTDLAKARKELKQLKEEARLVTMATSFSLSGSQKMGNGMSGVQPSDVSLNGKTPTMQVSLEEMTKKVYEKRKAANRPEALEEMSGEEVLEEKLVIQKALLHFENIHGRPVTKQEKELMKPMYERYRNVKRLAAKASSPKMKDPSMELQPILEHETMDFTQASPKHQRFPPGGCDDDSRSPHAENYDVVDMGTYVSVVVPPTDQKEEDIDGDETVRMISRDLEMKTIKRKLLQEDSCNLHELSHKELIEQEWKVRTEKKRLRRILREFEEGFQRQTGRKAQREDRAPIDSVYLEYKQVKAKLKLLEALLTKHEHHYTI